MDFRHGGNVKMESTVSGDSIGLRDVSGAQCGRIMRWSRKGGDN